LLLYYITDRRQLADDEPSRRGRLLAKIAEAARAGVDHIQLREKDLTSRDLESLATDAVAALRAIPGSRTRLLINSRCDLAIAAGAAGVHLPSKDLPADEARAIFTKAGLEAAIIGVSCHAPEDIAQASARGADFAVFGPVFGKRDVAAAGLDRLRAACAASPSFPVLALGGVTLENARACMDAGAAGVAAIRLFQRHDAAAIVAHLRGL
jgi:thiamine-phosphate pyrophosphorylase